MSLPPDFDWGKIFEAAEDAGIAILEAFKNWPQLKEKYQRFLFRLKLTDRDFTKSCIHRLSSSIAVLQELDNLLRIPVYIEKFRRGLSPETTKDVLELLRILTFNDDYYTRWTAATVRSKLADLNPEIIITEFRALFEKGQKALKKGALDSKGFFKLGKDDDVGSLSIIGWQVPQLLFIEEHNEEIYELSLGLVSIVSQMKPPCHIAGLTASIAQGFFQASQNPKVQIDSNLIRPLSKDAFWFTRLVAAKLIGYLLLRDKSQPEMKKILYMLQNDKVNIVREAADLSFKGICYPDEGEIVFRPELLDKIKNKVYRKNIVRKVGEDSLFLNFISRLADDFTKKKEKDRFHWEPPSDGLNGIGKDYWHLLDDLPKALSRSEFRKIDRSFYNLIINIHKNNYEKEGNKVSLNALNRWQREYNIKTGKF